MSMKINGNGNHSAAKYVEEAMRKKEAAQSEERAKAAENAKETAKTADKKDSAKEPAKASQPQDEYISSEKSGAKPTGLYHVGQDEEGNKKIFYDDPKKAGNEDGKKPLKANGENPEEGEEEYVANTDQVDREIWELKEKKSQIEQQLRSAAGDEKKTGELERKLSQVENELKQKDNDTYRRQHTQITRKNSD